MRTKKSWIIGGVVLAVVGVSLWLYLAAAAACRESVAWVSPMPGASGRPERLLVVYSAPNTVDESLVEAVDLRTGGRLWETELHIGDALPSRDPSAEAGSGLVVIAGRHATAPEADAVLQLHALRQDTGEVAWHRELPGASVWGKAFKVWIDDDLVLANASDRLVALALATGEVRWRVDGWRGGEVPVAAGGLILVAGFAGNPFSALDRRDGHRVPAPQVIWEPPHHRDGQLLAITADQGDSRDYVVSVLTAETDRVTARPLEVDGARVAFSRDWNPLQVAVGRDRLVALTDYDDDNRAQGVTARPLRSGVQGWHRRLPDGFRCTWWSGHAFFDPRQAAYLDLHDRFLPLVAERQGSGVGASPTVNELLVLDLETGAVKFESQPYEDGDPDVLHAEGRYFIGVRNTAGRNDGGLLVLDARTGTFVAAMRFENPTYAAANLWMPQARITDGLLCDLVPGLVIDAATSKVLFSHDTVVVADWGWATERLGPLPHDEATKGR